VREDGKYEGLDERIRDLEGSLAFCKGGAIVIAGCTVAFLGHTTYNVLKQINVTVAPKRYPARPHNAEHSISSINYADLWKHLEERGSKLKESMFKVVVWILAVASALLGFAVQQGFKAGSGLTVVEHSEIVVIVCLAGLFVLAYAWVVIRDHGEHINRIFDRADFARGGHGSLNDIWRRRKRSP
jgi:hypothetical protein